MSDITPKFTPILIENKLPNLKYGDYVLYSKVKGLFNIQLADNSTKKVNYLEFINSGTKNI